MEKTKNNLVLTAKKTVSQSVEMPALLMEMAEKKYSKYCDNMAKRDKETKKTLQDFQAELYAGVSNMIAVSVSAKNDRTYKLGHLAKNKKLELSNIDDIMQTAIKELCETGVITVNNGEKTAICYIINMAYKMPCGNFFIFDRFSGFCKKLLEYGIKIADFKVAEFKINL